MRGAIIRIQLEGGLVTYTSEVILKEIMQNFEKG